MKASKKSILYTIFFITAILMFMSAWLSSISVKTAVYADGALRDFYTEGASVRDADPTGIRFETKIKTTLYEELKGKSDISFGTLIVPKAVLGENELIVENLQAANAVTERWAADEGDYKKFNAVLVGGANENGFDNFNENYYNVPLVARAYYSYKDGDTVKYVYADSIERSVAEVASVAISKGNSGEFITEILNKVFDKAALAAFTADSVIVGNDREIKVKGLENLTPVWEVSGDTVSVENGKLIATAAGTATVTAKLGDRKISAEITAYADAESFKANGGYTIKSATATCTADGETVFAKDGFTDYVVATPALGHNMQEYTAPGMTGEECTLCHCRVLTVTAETDVPTGYDFAALDSERTIASVKEGETVLEATALTFNKEDAIAFTKNGSGKINGGNQAVKAYTVTYTDGSVYTVNLTLWSLFIDSKEDLFGMGAYAVQKNWKIHTGVEDSTVSTRRTYGYYKMTDNVTFNAPYYGPNDGGTNTWFYDDYLRTNAPDYYEAVNSGGDGVMARCGFWGTFDGNGKTIENFSPNGANGNHCGLIEILGTGGIIKNVTFKNVYYRIGTVATGIVAGYANGGTIENVKISGITLERKGASVATPAAGSGVGLLVGSVGTSAATNVGYTSWFTGLNLKNVEIDVVGENNFGTAISKDYFHALGEASMPNYTGFDDSAWIEAREKASAVVFPLICENVTINGISTIYGVSPKSGFDYVIYSAVKGVNGATENVKAA